MKELEKCEICPRYCKVNRIKNEIGLCGMGKEIKVARIAKHYFEEPPISGTNGSGAIFFSGCNMKCIFCQNYNISTNNFGKEISIDTLVEKMLNLQKEKAHNINLVTPTPFIPQIKEALIKAKKKGLKIPVVYNTSGYETVESIKSLDGLIDIYLPDLKYYDDILAMKYSKAPQYFDIATKAIEEMYKQVGINKFDKDGIMTKGVIVRHMMMPDCLEDSKKIIKYLKDTYNDKIYISIMNQYTPLKQVENIKELNHKVKEKDYEELINYACDLNITHAFMQVGETQNESFIPDFDLTGI